LPRNSIMYICTCWIQPKLGVRLADIPSLLNNDFARLSESTTRAAIQISRPTWAKLQYSPWLSTFCSPWWHLVKSSTSPSVQMKEFTSLLFTFFFGRVNPDTCGQSNSIRIRCTWTRKLRWPNTVSARSAVLHNTTVLRPIAFAETCRFLTIQLLEFQDIGPKNSLGTTWMIYQEKSEFWHKEILTLHKTIHGGNVKILLEQCWQKGFHVNS